MKTYVMAELEGQEGFYLYGNSKIELPSKPFQG
jgi:hypothetical protein